MSAAPVQVFLTADIDHVSRQLRRLARAVATAERAWDAHRVLIAVLVDECRNDERAERHPADVVRAGAWGRWYVRGALDPGYADPAQRDLTVQVLARRGHHEAAAGFLAGWVTRRELAPGPPYFAWHRLIGTTRAEVAFRG